MTEPINNEEWTSARSYFGLDASFIYSAKQARGYIKDWKRSIGLQTKLSALFLESLAAWEDEEDSVKEEHANLIKRMQALAKEMT